METPQNGRSSFHNVVYRIGMDVLRHSDIDRLRGRGIIITYYRYRNTCRILCNLQYAESISIDRNLKSSPYWGGRVTDVSDDMVEKSLPTCAHARIWKRGPREVGAVRRALIAWSGVPRGLKFSLWLRSHEKKSTLAGTWMEHTSRAISTLLFFATAK